MITQLRSFIVVLREGSLNRAAARLRMSQPALSRQMQALESEVGGRLLERSSAGVRPTDAGHLLAKRAEALIADYEAALTEARRLAQGDKSELKIGYLGSAAQNLLNPALVHFRAVHPQVKIRLLDLSPGEQIEALRRGEIDIALIGQEGEMASHDFYTRKLVTLPVIAILPADHPLASRKKSNSRNCVENVLSALRNATCRGATDGSPSSAAKQVLTCGLPMARRVSRISFR